MSPFWLFLEPSLIFQHQFDKIYWKRTVQTQMASHPVHSKWQYFHVCCYKYSNKHLKWFHLIFLSTCLLWDGCNVTEEVLRKASVPELTLFLHLVGPENMVQYRREYICSNCARCSILRYQWNKKLVTGEVSRETVITATTYVFFNIPSWSVLCSELPSSLSATMSPAPGCWVFKKVS